MRKNFDRGAKQMQTEYDEALQKKRALERKKKESVTEVPIVSNTSSPKRLNKFDFPQIEPRKMREVTH